MHKTRLQWLTAATLCAFAHAGALAQQAPNPALAARPVALAPHLTEITPPDGTKALAIPGTITLKPGSTSQILRAVPIRRRVPAAALRAQPVLALGAGRIDMRPVLANPAASGNVAAALAQQPSLGRVAANVLEVLEIDQGLIVRQYLAYRLNPAACANGASRQQLQRLQLDCFAKTAPAAQAAAFANPADAHYIADPATRAATLARARQIQARSRAEVAVDIAKLRHDLADPAARAAIAQAVGAAEAARLQGLDDAGLEAALVDSAEVEVEETMFIPKRGKATPLIPMASPTVLRGTGANRATPLRMPPAAVDASHALTEHLYVTGFTLDRRYEWRRGVSVTVSWCLVGCKKTYYAEAFAVFGYGLGLRLPVMLGGTWNYRELGGRESAAFTPTFATLNASTAQYSEAGLPANQLFGGRELVAEFDARAGFRFKLPVIGSESVAFGPHVDLTDALPEPMQHGQFRPPMPGTTLGADIVLGDVDLLGGLANYGVVGAKVMPSVKLGLTSKGIAFRLSDQIAGTTRTLERSGTSYPLAVDAATHASRFALGDPVYNLAFALTPGITARLFIDVAVWSNNWDWPIWFPQLTLELPPQGVDFSCHAGTICSRDYSFTASGAKEGASRQVEGNGGVWEAAITQWMRDFEPRQTLRCPAGRSNAICRAGILSLMHTTASDMRNRAGELEASREKSTDPARRKHIDDLTRAYINLQQRNADLKATGIIIETTGAAQKPP